MEVSWNKETIATVTSLSEFFDVLKYNEKLASAYSSDKLRLYFRGEKKLYDSPCQPSLFRKDNYLGEEDKIYYQTLRRMPEEFAGMSNLDVLAKMQHYGINTRMLDITSNPLSAMFFATDVNGDNNDDDGYIYILKGKSNPSEKNILAHDSDKALLVSTLPKLSGEHKERIKEFSKKYEHIQITHKVIVNEKIDGKNIDSKTIDALTKFIYECERERHALHKNHRVIPEHLLSYYFVKPQFNNERLKAQDGLFVLFGLDSTEENLEYYRIKIPSKYKKKIRAELFFYAGIRNSKIYMSLDDLSKDNKDILYQELINNEEVWYFTYGGNRDLAKLLLYIKGGLLNGHSYNVKLEEKPMPKEVRKAKIHASKILNKPSCLDFQNDSEEKFVFGVMYKIKKEQLDEIVRLRKRDLIEVCQDNELKVYAIDEKEISYHFNCEKNFEFLEQSNNFENNELDNLAITNDEKEEIKKTIKALYKDAKDKVEICLK